MDFHREVTALLPDLRAFGRFLTREPAIADDLVQDTVVRALSAQHSFAPGTNLKAWLFTIQRNAFFEQSRRRRRENVLLHERAANESPATTSSDTAARTDISDLQRVLWTLPTLLREALVLVGAQELSYEEAAQICEVPIGTMKARVSRARTQLAAAFAATGS